MVSNLNICLSKNGRRWQRKQETVIKAQNGARSHALNHSRMSIYSFILIFPDQTIMAQSGNEAASESDVTSHGTGRERNFDDDTLKGKDSYNC